MCRSIEIELDTAGGVDPRDCMFRALLFFGVIC